MISNRTAENRPALSRAWLVGLSLAAVTTSLGLRLAQLDSLPGEIYGDIVVVFNAVFNYLAAGRPVSCVDPAQLSCEMFAYIPRPAMVIWAPQDQTITEGLAYCLGPLAPRVHMGPHGAATFAYVALP